MITENQFNAIRYINGTKLREDQKFYLENYVNSDQFEIDTNLMPNDWSIQVKTIVAVDDYLKKGEKDNE